MHVIPYLLMRMLISIFSVLPFRMVYLFSDFLSFVILHIFGYRKRVVADNLARSFPEKDARERRQILRDFYKHLADLVVESLKAFSMTEEEVVRRYRYHHVEILNNLYDQGQSVICVAGHYGNWEWGGLATGLQLKHKPVGFYKPLSNPLVDGLIRRSRIKGRASLASISETKSTFEAYHGEPTIFYMVADQSPSSGRLAHWIKFLGQDTAVLHGPEKYARMLGLPVVFAVARKSGRGSYDIYFRLLDLDPLGAPPGRITERFMQALESEILAAPAFYLWSHKRWKLKR